MARDYDAAANVHQPRPDTMLPMVRAEVAELVDALDSKSSGVTPVWVRVPPSALRGGFEMSRLGSTGHFRRVRGKPARPDGRHRERRLSGGKPKHA